MNAILSYSGSILSGLLSFILIYKYVAILLITYASAAGIPIPSTSVVIAAAAFSSQGYLNFELVLLTAWIGNVTGDNTAYFLTRIFGRRIINRVGILKKIFDSRQVGKIEDILRSKTFITIFISRFMSQIGPIVDLLSGLITLDYRKYIVPVLLGELTQVLIFSGVGYELGDQWQSSIGIIGAVGILLAVCVLLYVVRKVFFGDKPKIKV
jgi:membrane-associated protein